MGTRASAGPVRARAAAALLGLAGSHHEPRLVQARAARGPPRARGQALPDVAGLRLLAAASGRVRHDDPLGLLPSTVAQSHAPAAAGPSQSAGGADVPARANT